MPLRIEEVKVRDLVRELSPGALRYYADMELSDEWQGSDSPLLGKFVRLGGVIVVGTCIEYGPLHECSSLRPRIRHTDIIEHTTHDMGNDVLDRINAGSPEDCRYIRDKLQLCDAGNFRIETNLGEPAELHLFGESLSFGRGEDFARARTGEIAQFALGSEINISFR